MKPRPVPDKFLLVSPEVLHRPLTAFILLLNLGVARKNTTVLPHPESLSQVTNLALSGVYLRGCICLGTCIFLM